MALVLPQTGGEPLRVIEWLEKHLQKKSNASFCREAACLVHAALTLHDAGKKGPYFEFASRLGAHLRATYIQPDGSLIEYDRNSWIEPSDLWRTVPWGTGFRGHELLDVYVGLRNELDAEERREWERQLSKTGEWIDGNPVLGSFVFNCAADLCGLLWDLGEELGRPEWKVSALNAVKLRISRDVDEEGWIQGENGGCSGAYQLLGIGFLADFAWKSRDPFLVKTVKRIFSGVKRWAAPDLSWAGNFGTRSSSMGPLDGRMLLVLSALGDSEAAQWVSMHGQPIWSESKELWRAALKTAPKPFKAEATVHFKGISGTVLRAGPWMAWFANYDRSLWARGFIDLWHRDYGMIFSTLHSLPSDVEKSKLLLGDTSDWAGFPRVTLKAGATGFNSHQEIENLVVTENPRGGLEAAWTERLKARDGVTGGRLSSRMTLQGERLSVVLKIDELKAGQSFDELVLDFHFLKPKTSFYGVWLGEEAEAIERGELPKTGGQFWDRNLAADEPPVCGIQIGRGIGLMRWEKIPNQARITLGHRVDQGLHTGKTGGVRSTVAGLLNPESGYSSHFGGVRISLVAPWPAESSSLECAFDFQWKSQASSSATPHI